MTNQKEILEKIEVALDSARPYLITDGGNVEIVELTDDMVLKIRLIGACGTCPQSYMTFKTGIETAIKQAAPEIKQVIPLNFLFEDEKV
jgi:Fe-S cluster biogenesis protein NfuA